MIHYGHQLINTFINSKCITHLESFFEVLIFDIKIKIQPINHQRILEIVLEHI